MAPTFTSVVAELSKLQDYCLSEIHPRGRHKARVFRAKLGLTAADAEWVRGALILAAPSPAARFAPTHADVFGQRWVLDVELATAVGAATVRAAWIVRAGEAVLRLTSCYVL